MTALWIPVALIAACFQTVRFMLQKVLANVTLSAAGATFSRFLYSAPFILILLTVYVLATGSELPAVSPLFGSYALIGSVSQILATICVVALFRQRNFAVGMTFKNTEVLQTALVGLVVLGDSIPVRGWLAIVIGFTAVLVLSKTAESTISVLQTLRGRGPLLGLLSGVLFAFSAVSYRGASLQLEEPDAVLRAGVTLAVVVCLQTGIMAIWLVLREPGEIGRVWKARSVAVWVGLTSMAGSYCWFLAFTLQNAAYVKAMGQVELLLSLLASLLFFKERVTRRELFGMFLLLLSILVLLLAL